MTRRIYPRPPIVEAIIDLRFVAKVSGDDLFDALRLKLAERYPAEPQRQDRVEVSASIGKDALATSARRTARVNFLCSGDGLRLLGCGLQTLSVHVLAPYPGWERFIELAEEAVAALPKEASQEGINSLTVRYIDRIMLPVEAQSFADYLLIMPPRPEPMPSRVSTFHQVMQSTDPEDGITASLTLASGPPTSEGASVLIYDLSLQRQGEPLCALEGSGWREIAEDLHCRQRDIFEGSITNKMRELFR